MATAKKKATTKKAKAATRKGGRGTKAAFVRSMPADMPAKQVVEQAAKQGVKLSENHVYAVRSAAKKPARTATKATVKKSSPKRSAPLKSPGVGTSRGTKPASLESQLRRAIGELGLARAREVFAEVERAFAGA